MQVNLVVKNCFKTSKFRLASQLIISTQISFGQETICRVKPWELVYCRFSCEVSISLDTTFKPDKRATIIDLIRYLFRYTVN